MMTDHQFEIILEYFGRMQQALENIAELLLIMKVTNDTKGE